eukprot:CAMPEP_0177676034 /NCGR_PEP_ID=MMETSP0447-20121125/27548_1 /TAXON_ID=0 /ORGANISM="Stygamoeba regulata, Strain BSH-02190019" /LENGTH=407 /DNA_ID=CAMNT_0019184519 /DNA_START=51 /DNA_END=1274 /DNA_ORIENTATION=-
MANRTDVQARNVHGMNPQFLVEEILRMRIWDSLYWKEHCFALNAETLVDKAVELDHYGGAYGGNNLPTDFLCLLLKMLAIQPEREIVLEFLKNEDYRYVRLLAAFYLRLVGSALDIYQYLEPLLNDYRRVRFRERSGDFVVHHIDEFVDLLLTEERVCDIILPRIPSRQALEQLDKLKPRVSLLELGLPGGEAELTRLLDAEIDPDLIKRAKGETTYAGNALDDHDHKSTPLPPRRPDSVAVIVLVLVLVLALVLDLDRLRRDEAGHLARGHDHPVHIAPPPPPIRPLPLLVARHPLIVPGPHATGGIAHDHVHRTAQSRTATNVGARDIRALGLLPPLLVLLPREVVAIALQRVVVIVVPRAVLDVSALVLALRVVDTKQNTSEKPVDDIAAMNALRAKLGLKPLK